MAGEKRFETRVKTWLESLGIYGLGTPPEKMPVSSIGYWEKRWGGGYSKSGLPDMHLVVKGINIDVELKDRSGRVNKIQKFMLAQINNSGSIGVLLFPDGFEEFKELVKGVIDCSLVIPELEHLKTVHSNSKCDILTDFK